MRIGRKAILILLSALLMLPIASALGRGRGIALEPLHGRTAPAIAPEGRTATLSLLTKTKKGKKKKTRKDKADASPMRPALTEADERRRDYFLLEAARQNVLQNYDAAYDLLQHCLEIDSCCPEALYEMAQYYTYLKQNRKGLEALQKAVRYDPDNYWYSQALADFYLQIKDYNRAIALLESMTRQFPNRTDLLYTLMELYNRQGRAEQVVGIVERMEERMGKSEQLSMAKIRIYQQQGDSARAYAEVQSLMEEYPYEMRYPLILANIYMQEGRTDEAYTIYQRVMSEEPDNTAAMYALAIYYQQTGRQEQYDRQVDSLLLNAKVETDTKMGIMRQIILRSNQTSTPTDSLRIIHLFDRMMEQDLDNTDLPLLYAQYLLSKDMQDEAIPVLNRVIALDPEQSGARMMLLGEAVGRQDYAEIQRLCEAGVEATPDALEYPFYLAVCYYQDRRTDDAINVCRRALTRVTRETNAELVSDFYNILGDAYHSQGRNPEAYAAYDTAITYYPDNYSALNNYAYYLSLEQRDLDRAEEMSYRTIKAEPANATYLDTYAWILFVKGNYAQARIYIDEAMKNDGASSTDVLEHCGDIYFMTGDAEGALDWWRQAQEKGSDSTTLKEKIRRRKYIPPK